MTQKYQPEPYWSEVAKRIESREGQNVIAGDDEPFYVYKRARFLNLLNAVDFQRKSVLEVGSGPGGNLLVIEGHNPKKLVGADISAQMLQLARKVVRESTELVKTNGTRLPFSDDSFDIVFTATVLQHNTDRQMVTHLLEDIFRVSRQQVCLFERIESDFKGDELCEGRPISFYEKIAIRNGFVLKEVDFINIRMSYLASGAIRKLFNPSNRKEGEPITMLSRKLQTITLPVTRRLDKLFPADSDLAKLVFVKKGQS